MSRWRTLTSYVCQGTLGPALFNVFSVTRDSGIESTLKKFADDARMCGAAGAVEGKEAIQGNLHRLEKLGPCEHHEVQQGKVQYPVPVSGQSQAQVLAGWGMN